MDRYFSKFQAAASCSKWNKGDRSLACSSRPVSLTYVPCKLLEHLVCSNIMAHLDEHKLLSDRQHAFRKRHSCEFQLITVTNDWAKILDNGGQVYILILDFLEFNQTGPPFCQVSLRAPFLDHCFSHFNDITTDTDSEIRLFADDCVFDREIKGTEDTVKLQEDIDRLGCWARKWDMRFQPVNGNIMQITRKRIKRSMLPIM